MGELNNAGRPDVLWGDPDTGQTMAWFENWNGSFDQVRPYPECANGCTSRSVGIGDFNNDYRQDILKFDPRTGDLWAVLLDGAAEPVGHRYINWNCSLRSGCATYWRPIGVGDVNLDGRTDIMWFNGNTGEVSSWLLNGIGQVTGS